MKNPYALGLLLFSLQQPRFSFVREHTLVIGNDGNWRVRPCLEQHGLKGPWEVYSQEEGYPTLDLTQIAQLLQVHGMYPHMAPNQVFHVRKVSILGDQIEIVGDIVEILPPEA